MIFFAIFFICFCDKFLYFSPKLSKPDKLLKLICERLSKLEALLFNIDFDFKLEVLFLILLLTFLKFLTGFDLFLIFMNLFFLIGFLDLFILFILIFILLLIL